MRDSILRCAAGLAFLNVVVSCGAQSDLDGNGGAIALSTTVNGTVSASDVFIPPASPGAPTGMENADPWSIDLTPGSYTIRMCQNPPTNVAAALDPYVDIYLGTGASATWIASQDDGGGGVNTLFILNVTTAGTYTIVARPLMGTVNTGDPSGSDNYQLRIDSGSDPSASCPIL